MTIKETVQAWTQASKQHGLSLALIRRINAHLSPVPTSKLILGYFKIVSSTVEGFPRCRENC